MTITAKYSGKCKGCGAFLPAGSKIEWTKAGGARCAGGCHGSAAPKKASSPSKAGECEAGEGVTILHRFVGHGGKPPVEREVGRSFRARASNKVLTSVGCSCSYQSDEDNEDMGDMQGGGWTLHLYCREASAEEVAKVEATEAAAAAEKAKKEAEKAAAAAEVQAAWTALAATRKGLVCLDGYGNNLVAKTGDLLAKAGSGNNYASVSRVTLLDGTEALIEHVHNYDDWRSHLWVDAATAEKVYAAHRFATGTTTEKAAEWLKSFSNCYGAGYFKWVVDNS